MATKVGDADAAEEGSPPPWFDFDGIEVGLDLGSVEYLLAERQFDRYRQAVEDPEGLWVLNGLKPVGLLISRAWRVRPGQRHVNTRHKTEYFNLPMPGTKLILSGRIVDKYVKREKPYVVLGIDVVDEDGLPVERFERTLMVSAPKLGEKWWGKAGNDSPRPARPETEPNDVRIVSTPVGPALPTVSKHVTLEKMRAFEALVPERGPSYHDDERTAKEEGMKAPIMSAHQIIAYIHEMLNKFMGPDWVRGGKLDLKFLRPIVPGDSVTVGGIVAERHQEDGRVRLLIEVWAENQRGEKTAAGSASAFVAQ